MSTSLAKDTPKRKEAIVSTEEDIAPPDNKRQRKSRPYDDYMAKLNKFLASHDDFVGTMLMKGIRRGDDDEDDDDDDEDEEDRDNYTTEQMESLRYIVMTKNRIKQFEEMKKLIIGNQADEENEMFCTSFSYKVLESWNILKRQLSRSKSPNKALDMLLAYTSILKDYDFWMNDNEGGMDVLIKGLGSAWKKVLKNSDKELGWDTEYTKPGVMELLNQFESQVNGLEDYYELGKFKYA
jgi:hypothetical protein